MEATGAYYSKWLGQDGILNRDWKGVEYVYSEQRNTVQHGYAHRFDIYALCQKDRIVVSYGDRIGNWLEAMKSQIRDVMPAEEVRQIMEKIFQRNVFDNMKYVFKNMPDIPSDAKALAPEDYREYEDFWRKCNPGCKNTEWLKEYFEEMA